MQSYSGKPIENNHHSTIGFRGAIDDARFGFVDLDNLLQTYLRIQLGVEIKDLPLQLLALGCTYFLTNESSPRKSDYIFEMLDLDNLLETYLRI